jgi:hypothetical protein
MVNPHNAIPAKPFAGLYLRTRRTARFWGWSNLGWGSLHSAEKERPVTDLAAWLRLAHASLDLPNLPSPPSASSPAQHVDECEAAQPARTNRRLQFVCNRRMIGWFIR